ncbi:MAG: hypothetical protein VKO01_00905 [Cyanobacteriota bacterium]|nr:hypothetical protein [Cyanobacteriota bacterium]
MIQPSPCTPGQWLRWCDQEGQWILTETEQERQAKEQERQRAVRVSVPKGIVWRLSSGNWELTQIEWSRGAGSPP